MVGLTASPGAGNAKSVEMAAEHILTLCANMDAVDISTVRDEQNLKEMMNYIRKATEGSVQFIDAQLFSMYMCRPFLLTLIIIVGYTYTVNVDSRVIV